MTSDKPSTTDHSDLRALLTQVAAGSVAPDEASEKLASSAGVSAAPSDTTQATSGPSGVRVVPAPSSGRETSETDAGSQTYAGAPSEAGTGPIQRVVVRATAVKLVLLGDPTVTGATVEGPHVARRDGSALIIETDTEPRPGDFSYVGGLRKGMLFGGWRSETVVVKMRPELPVEVTVQAGSVVATRLEGGMRFLVEAGSIQATDCRGPIDGRVEAGSAKLGWLLDKGDSKLRCELGSIKLSLDPRSDVTVTGRAELGSMDFGSGGGPRSGQKLVVGNGTASLDVKVELGSAKVGVGA